MSRIALYLLGAVAALALSSVIIAAAGCYHLSPGYCYRLQARAEASEVRAALESWVSENWTGKRVPIEDVSEFDGIVPGLLWLPASFDPSVLGMDGGAHVRLLGPSPRDILDDRIVEHVNAVYFTDRSRYGVLVQLPDHPRYSGQGFALYPISERVSVLCQD